MGDTKLENSVRDHRDRLRLSQQTLAERVGVSRQAIIAIEGGKQVPSTSLALQLAQALGCGVEDLFRLDLTDRGLEVRLPFDRGEGGISAKTGDRVAIGRVDGHWIAHVLDRGAAAAADGIVLKSGAGGATTVRPLFDPDQLSRNVLVAGCAPLIAVLAQHVGGRFHDARVEWLPAPSRRALDFLREGLVHVAGVHFSGEHQGVASDNLSAVREKLAGERLVVINLTRWRQGFVVPTGNPLGIRSAADLLRPGIRVVAREEGAGARELVSRLVRAEGADPSALTGPVASGHEEVAWHVRCGGADVGVAIESVALAAGLGFVPLTDERFDFVVDASTAESAPVSRLIEVLDERAFRADVAGLPGYDSSEAGHATTLDAA